MDLRNEKIEFKKKLIHCRQCRSDITKLELIKGTCKDFDDSHALKLLYFSLVRSQLEYDNLIWHTNSII